MGSAIVTGGGRGIGRSISYELSEMGYGVSVVDIDQENIERTVDKITNNGNTAVGINQDITDENAPENIISETESSIGEVEVLVNNAAIETEVPAIKLSDDEWNRVIDVNMNSGFRLTKRVANKFIDADISGDIVNITSFHDTMPRTEKIHYDTSKAGLWMMTKDFALELSEYGITVNCIAPGVMRTPMNKDLQDDSEQMDKQRDRIPLGRLGEPEEIAQTVKFLIESDYITGTRITVDGGVSLVG